MASSGGPMRRLLVVAEAALAVVLIIGAALLVRSYLALIRVDAGYQPAAVLTADIALPRGDNREQRPTALANALVERLQGRPGIGAVAVGTMAPFGGLSSFGFALPGLVNGQGQPVIARALQAVVTPGYRDAWASVR